MENVNLKQKHHQDNFKVKDFVSYIWQLRFIIILFAVVACVIAFVTIKFTNPIYERHAQIMVMTNNNTNNQTDILSDITGIKSSSNLDNEIFILKSSLLMTKVVETLGLNQRYYTSFVPKLSNPPQFLKDHFSIRKIEYYNNSPFEMSVEFDALYSEQSRPSSISLTFIPRESDRFNISELLVNGVEVNIDNKRQYAYGDTITSQGFSAIIKSEFPQRLVKGNNYISTWSNPALAGRRLTNQLSVTAENGASKVMSDVVTLSFIDTSPKRAGDIINELIAQYNQESRTYRNASIQSSLDFINARLQAISVELGNVETDYMNYQTSRLLVDIQAQSQMTLSADSEYESQLTEIRLQRNIIQMIKDDIERGEDIYEIIPANIGLSDANLNSIINNYNTLLSDRNRLVANSSESNPRVRSINLELKNAKNNILLNIDNLEKVYGIRENELITLRNQSKAKVSALPTEQFALNQIERKQQIIEPLYLLLQQKKEEAQISIYSISDNVRIIESSYGSNNPIKPQKIKIFLYALLIGCCIPPVFVFLREYLKSKIETKEDITNILDYPFIGTIPIVDNLTLPQISGGRDIKTESFRMLRSNLGFIPGKVFEVTSSIPGEGKSFISANLAVSLSHIGKRVVLVGVDLRKPALKQLFNDIETNHEKTVVNYLIGKVNTPAYLASKWEKSPNLDIIFAGSVPPNPTELLSTERFVSLMEYLRYNYDYVILDSAPAMLVSDSIIINKFVDSTIYVIRSNYTPIEMLEEINNLFEKSKINNPVLILNGLNIKSKILKYGYGKYGYGYGKYGYGYGKYGYGYGYGYGDEAVSKKKSKNRKSQKQSEEK